MASDLTDEPPDLTGATRLGDVAIPKRAADLVGARAEMAASELNLRAELTGGFVCASGFLVVGTLCLISGLGDLIDAIFPDPPGIAAGVLSADSVGVLFFGLPLCAIGAVVLCANIRLQRKYRAAGLL